MVQLAPVIALATQLGPAVTVLFSESEGGSYCLWPTSQELYCPLRSKKLTATEVVTHNTNEKSITLFYKLKLQSLHLFILVL